MTTRRRWAPRWSGGAAAAETEVAGGAAHGCACRRQSHGPVSATNGQNRGRWSPDARRTEPARDVMVVPPGRNPGFPGQEEPPGTSTMPLVTDPVTTSSSPERARPPLNNSYAQAAGPFPLPGQCFRPGRRRRSGCVGTAGPGSRRETSRTQRPYPRGCPVPNSSSSPPVTWGDAAEGAVVMTDPPAAAEDHRDEHRDDDQVDTQDGQQCDQHGDHQLLQGLTSVAARSVGPHRRQAGSSTAGRCSFSQMSVKNWR